MFVSVVILLCASISGVVLRKRLKCPDLFDLVAAWTYDNPSLPVEPEGTTMDIARRIRALRNVDVRVGDVWGDREVGKTALGLKSETDRLTDVRLYM
jgi:hypothetical protein